MAMVPSRGNGSTELALAHAFRAGHVTGWRRHRRVSPRRSRHGRLRGQLRWGVRPDFVFPRIRLAVFVDGCFWHSCPQHGSVPSTRTDFWRAKLAANQLRDRAADSLLRSAGWTVIHLWEHSVRADAVQCAARVKAIIFRLERQQHTNR